MGSGLTGMRLDFTKRNTTLDFPGVTDSARDPLPEVPSAVSILTRPDPPQAAFPLPSMIKYMKYLQGISYMPRALLGSGAPWWSKVITDPALRGGPAGSPSLEKNGSHLELRPGVSPLHPLRTNGIRDSSLESKLPQSRISAQVPGRLF